MSSLAEIEKEALAVKVRVTEDEVIVDLLDGRRISTPVTWYPRLLHGNEVERNTLELIGRGSGIHWPLLDEDLSVSGMLKGFPSGESESSLQTWIDQRKK